MKILIADWDSFGDRDIEEVFAAKGFDVVKSPYVESEPEPVTTKQLADFAETIASTHPDCVFSYNFFPPISDICQQASVPYISWVYDSPYMHLYSKSIENPVNRVFLFDGGLCQALNARGIDTVYHLPLGVNTARYNRQCGTPDRPKKSGFLNLTTGRLSLESDISFVGSLYTEERHRLYDRLNPDAYTGGYLDAMIAAQKHIYGADIIEPMLTDDIIEKLQKGFPYAVEDGITMTAREFYAQYVLARKVTSVERSEIFSLIGQIFPDKKTLLFTNDPDVRFRNVKNIGAVEYYKEMPDVFHSAKINLNITLRSILTGIPLRALDIMASGGFLLSNYQIELAENFAAGEEYDFYSDYEDLITKIEYYLSHSSERKDIAAAGWEKVQKEFSLEKRVEEMVDNV